MFSIDFSSLAEETELTPEYVKECFEYDPGEGILKWKERPLHHFITPRYHKTWNSRLAGSIVKKDFINLHSKSYKVDRIVWFLAHGEWPKWIYHLNNNKLDNRLSNLINLKEKVDLSYFFNQNKIYGVNYDKHLKRYSVQFKNKRLKCHTKDFLEACCIRKSSEAQELKRLGIYA